MQSASSEMLAWMNHKQESRLPQKYQPQVIPDDTPLMTESKKELKSLLMRVKEGKAGLKLSIKKKERKKENHGIWSHHFMANRRGKSGNSAFLSSKTTVDADCSHEIKRCLLLRRKAMTNLDSVLKSRDTTLQAKLHVLKVILFPVYL